MPAPYQITGGLMPTGGASQCYKHGSDLYVIGLSHKASSSSDHSKIGIFKSTDSGATWTRVGTEQSIGSSDEVGAPVDAGAFSSADLAMISVCADIDYPTSPYLYALYLDSPDGNLHVSRANLSTDSWDVESAAGPVFLPAGGYNAIPSWRIEQATDGIFGILAGLSTDTGDADRVFTFSLWNDLGTWSSRSELAGQDAGKLYEVGSVARGTSGRVHGLVTEIDGSTITARHVLVIGGGGSLGGAFSLMAADSRWDTAVHGGASDAAGNVAFLLAKDAPGFGTPWKFSTAIAVSADTPTWSISDVDTTANTASGASNADASIIGTASGFSSVYHLAADQAPLRSTYTSLWSADGSIFAGPAITYAWDPSTGLVFSADGTDLWFYPISGTGQTLEGSAGIPSLEAFGQAHGVIGGGDPYTCGTLTSDPIPPGCPSTAGDPTDATQCSTQGRAY